MRWPARMRGLGTVKDSASVASSLSQAAMRRISGGSGGEDVVLLAGGEGEEEEGDGGPEAEEEAGAFLRVRVRMETRGRMDLRQGTVREGVEEVGAPGHEPDEEESPEEVEGDGVVVAGDAEVEVAEEMLVDEVEPEPAVDVAVGGERDVTSGRE